MFWRNGLIIHSFIYSYYVDYKNNFVTNFQILYTDVLVSFVAESNCKMNKEKLLRNFKKKENTPEHNEDIAITNVVTSVTKYMINAVLSFATDEIKKNHAVDLSSTRSKFQKM